MQIVPIIVVLGGVSWVVCAVSLQGETGHREIWPALGDAAHRVSLGVGTAWRTRGPGAGRAARHKAWSAMRSVAGVLTEVGLGMPAAARSVRDGVGEDAAAVREWANAGRERLVPIALRVAALTQTAVRTLGPPLSTFAHATGRALDRAWRRAAAARGARAERSVAGRRARPGAVGFAETLSVTWEVAGAVQPLDLPAGLEAEEQGHHVRGLLGLILLVALIAVLIAAGLMTVAWGLKHMIVFRRAA